MIIVCNLKRLAGSDGVFKALEIAEMTKLALDGNSSAPFVSWGVEADTVDAGAVQSGQAAVLQIDLVGHRSEIVDPVVQSVAISMVDFEAVIDLTEMETPDQAMGREVNSVDAYDAIGEAAGSPGHRARGAGPDASPGFSPEQLACAGVIVKRLA